MSTTESPTRYELDDHIARIRLDRPERLNAVTPALYESLESRLEQAAADDARVVILEGAGRAFCVGADMKNHGEVQRSTEERQEYVWNAQNACEEVQTHPAPVVAKVHGYAIGAGAELALSADFVITASDAEFRFPEVSIGTYVGGGITYTLARRVGQARAKELVLSAATLDGAEAASEGVATTAVPDPDLDETVAELASSLASHAPIPMQLAKSNFNRAGDATRDELIDAEAEALLQCMATADWEEGVEAFAEDRDPTFVGE
ncbi:enoyl-CoA hydratase/isomerase family protein [Halobellus sp. Atlit-38R]|nr:enoyl-CoA hydratase/isomerase family protein [Halobellus sp. Atlit-38R]